MIKSQNEGTFDYTQDPLSPRTTSLLRYWDSILNERTSGSSFVMRG